MLSIEDNDKITRTGPGTPMGNLFRRFWLPVLLSSELPGADCTPVRLKILSERLVAFRDTNGRIGLLEERCPHRHASLYWGRNEECGLRCVYHGWKFDVLGACVDQPAEPPDSHFKDHVRAVAYPTHEVAGVIWAYMGPSHKQPPFPEFDWTFFSSEHWAVHKRLQQCNYLQNLEGELDTSHSNFLHRSWREGESFMAPANDNRKRYLIAQTDFGLLCMGRSDTDDGRFYWKMTPYHLPAFTIAPTAYDAYNTFLAAVPIDDEQMYGFTISWNPFRPLSEEEGGSALGMKVDPKTFVPEANITNDYQRDLERQRKSSWTGMRLIKEQDMAVQEDQDGPILRRFEEHLGVTDRAIVGARRLLLNLAEDLERGIEPPYPQHAAAYRVRSVRLAAPRESHPIDLWRAGQPDTAGLTTIGAAEL